MRNTQLIRDVYASFGRGDLPAVLAACAADVDWRSHAPSCTPYSGHFRGPAGAKRFLESFLSTVRLNRFEPHTFLEDGEVVVVLGREGGTVVPTSREVLYDWVHVFKVRDGKIAEFREFVDAATVEAAFRRS